MKSDQRSQSIPFLFFLLSAAVYFFSSNQVDPDLWGHLTYGQYIFEHIHIPGHDFYSYTAAGARWINHEWLSEIFFYAAYRYAQSAGLIILKTSVGILAMAPLYLAMRRRTRSVISMFLLLVPMYVIAYGFAMRPQIFTYAFFAWVVFLIDNFENDGNITRLYILPILFLLWANMHGGFAAGLGLLVIYIAWKAVRREVTPGLAYVASASAIATIINPYGISLLVFVFKSLFVSRPYIGEWGMIRSSERYFICYISLALCVFFGAIFANRKRLIYETIALTMVFCLSFMQKRHIMLFAILAGIYLPKYINHYAEKALLHIEKKIFGVLIGSLCAGVIAIIILCAGHCKKSDPLQIEIPQNQYPVNAVNFMRLNNINGNILAWFDWAQECMRCLPGSKIFFDGRYDTVYSDDFIKGYFDMLLCKKFYWEYLDNFPETDVMLLNIDKNFLFSLSLASDKKWVLVYSDKIGMVWLMDNKRNKIPLEMFKKGSLRYSAKSPPYYLGKELD